jgi:hypothetical protein
MVCPVKICGGGAGRRSIEDQLLSCFHQDPTSHRKASICLSAWKEEFNLAAGILVGAAEAMGCVQLQEAQPIIFI